MGEAGVERHPHYVSRFTFHALRRQDTPPAVALHPTGKPTGGSGGEVARGADALSSVGGTVVGGIRCQTPTLPHSVTTRQGQCSRPASRNSNVPLLEKTIVAADVR